MERSATAREKRRMKSRYKSLKLAGLCPQCGGNRDKEGRLICGACSEKRLGWHQRNRKRSNLNAMKYRRGLWDLFFKMYGSKCSCCEERRVEFLTVDHIRGGGRKHRAALGDQMPNLLRWCLKKRRKSIRVLCMNCNLSYGLYGYCPHQKERKLHVV